MKVIVLALCLAAVVAGQEGAWWQSAQPRPQSRPATYVDLRGRVFSARPESEPRPRLAWFRPQPQSPSTGVDLRLSPEEFFQYQMFKRMMAEKRQQAEEEKQQKQEEKRRQAEEEQKKNGDLDKLEEVMAAYTNASHQYVFAVTLGLAKVCQCSQAAQDSSGVSQAINSTETSPAQQGDVDHFLDLVYGKSQLTSQIVGKMKQMKNADMKKLAFGGLVKSLCWQYKSYASTLKSFKARFQEMAAQQQNAPSMS